MLATTILACLTSQQSGGNLGIGRAACNDTARELQVSAGIHNLANETCAQASFTVGVVTFTTPASCVIGYAEYFGTVYSCAGGTAEGIHCDPRGYSVKLEIASGGSCPSIVGVGGSFDSWDDVPGLISAALTCQSPTRTTTKDYSAQTWECSGDEADVPGLGQQHESADGTPYLLVQGTPSPPGVAPVNPFLGTHEEAEDGDTDSLAGWTGEVVRSYEAWAGMDFSAEVVVESHAPGSEPHVTTSLLEGVVLADGRFDVRVSTPVQVEGEPGVLQQRWAFDGRQLLADVTDQEVANAYSTTFFRFDHTFSTTCWELLAVYDWLTDPLDFPLYDTVAFEEVVSEPGRVLARRTLGGSTPFVSCEYLFDTSGQVAHPLRRRLFDPLGRTIFETEYADFSREGASWRPRSTRRTRSWPDTPGEVEVTTVRVLRADRLEVSTPLPAVEFPVNRLWQLWE